jgi:hypothetical protein
VIVQSAAPGRPSFIIDQLEHTALAGRFAAAWGNDAFAPLTPRELMLEVIAHHDDGWDVIDAAIGRDDDSGLPWNLVKTPLPQIIRSGSRGPDLNERRHAYCGLISSMHTYGLYCGRYGLSDKIFVNMIPAEHRPAVDDLLARELGRQERLKARLAADAATAAWVAEPALMHNYKLLQFFDTLCLYFNCTHDEARGRATFPNVPRQLGDDVTITVERIAAGQYRVDPYPFHPPALDMGFLGRFMSAQPVGTDMPAAIAALPVVEERFTLVAP